MARLRKMKTTRAWNGNGFRVRGIRFDYVGTAAPDLCGKK